MITVLLILQCRSDEPVKHERHEFHLYKLVGVPALPAAGMSFFCSENEAAVPLEVVDVCFCVHRGETYAVHVELEKMVVQSRRDAASLEATLRDGGWSSEVPSRADEPPPVPERVRA